MNKRISSALNPQLEILVNLGEEYSLRNYLLFQIEVPDSQIMAVRSCVVPQEYNLLPNPEHPDADAVIEEVVEVTFQFDDRLGLRS